MGILSRLLGRDRGLGDVPDDDETEGRRLVAPEPTATMRPIPKPAPTPSARQLENPGTTAGTRSYRSPAGTPSTQRIHNPLHPGR